MDAKCQVGNRWTGLQFLHRMIELSILQKNSDEKLENSQKSYKFVQKYQILLKYLKIFQNF